MLTTDSAAKGPSRATLAYLVVVACLVAAQVVATQRSLDLIRYEDLAESVRNVYWLDERTVYDGVSSNVGWYATLLLLYKILGFSLHTAKWWRVVLHAISLLAAAAFLRRRFSDRVAWLPLVAWGLSPAMLFFNTLQTSFGSDLQFLPICLLLIDRLSPAVSKRALAGVALAWAVVMWACMTYPTFLFLVPALAALDLWRVREIGSRGIVAHVGAAALGFVAPLGAILLYVKDAGLLLGTQGRPGIFRGGGAELVFNTHWVAENVRLLVHELFVGSNSYYFEIPQVELAGALTVVAALVIVAAALVFAARGVISRPVVIGAVATLVVTAVVGGIAGGPSGLRRFTPVLPVFYCLFAFVAQQALAGDARRWVRWALVAALAIVPLHHLTVFPENSVFRAPGNRYAMWGRSPLAAVDGLLKTAVADGVVIQCTNAAGKRQLCRYAETFATVAGACRWNSLPCRETMAFDLKTEKVIPVSISLWETYYWQH